MKRIYIWNYQSQQWGKTRGCTIAVAIYCLSRSTYFSFQRVRNWLPSKWHVCSALICADVVTLLAPTSMVLKAILNTCTDVTASHNLLYNAPKTKCTYFNDAGSHLQNTVKFIGRPIEYANSTDVLGVSVTNSIKEKNVNSSVEKFYCRVNSVLYDFKDIPCDVKAKLLDSYCLDVYGSQYKQLLNRPSAVVYQILEIIIDISVISIK